MLFHNMAWATLSLNYQISALTLGYVPTYWHCYYPNEDKYKSFLQQFKCEYKADSKAENQQQQLSCRAAQAHNKMWNSHKKASWNNPFPLYFSL